MSTSTAGPLAALREAVAACDVEIVELLGHRMGLIRRVAELKARLRLPLFDRAREGELVEELVGRAAELQVPGEVVRDVYAALLDASHAAQRPVLHAADARYSIGIIGGTSGVGEILAHRLGAAGYRVEVTGLDSGADRREIAARHDLVLVAAPGAMAVGVITDVAPHVRAGACLADVTHVKVGPMRAMLEHARADVDVVGSHPVLEPSGRDLARQSVVLVRGRGDGGFGRVRRLYESFGAEVVEASAEEHDAQTALVRAVLDEKSLIVGSILARLGADLAHTQRFASAAHRTELSAIGRTFAQEAGPFAEGLASSKMARIASRIFDEEAGRLARAVEAGDRASLADRFREVAAYVNDRAPAVSTREWSPESSEVTVADLDSTSF